MTNVNGHAKEVKSPRVAWELRVLGAVQGVGFRPFVYRTALAYGLGGWVRNDANGVSIHVAGPENVLEQFQHDLVAKAPAPARVREIRGTAVEGAEESAEFRILESEQAAEITAAITPDLAMCPDCLRELFDVKNPRYRYPFINCTHCGPRYSIIERIPYDRPHTTMRHFTMCARCAAEYEDPANRRFHAQPNACPECGPQLALWSASGRVIAERHDAVLITAEALLEGKIVAVKGVGGFHLMADARNGDAVGALRERKHREEKPFAVMFPSMALIRDACVVSPLEAQLLRGPEAPIVLLWDLQELKCGLSKAIKPHNPLLGVMLPYAPLHHVLMEELGVPVVATSGNLSDEPICIDEQEALTRLKGIADLFLVHDRPIARPVDDSIVRVLDGRPVILRRARGYAPRPVTMGQAASEPIMAVGAHLKNTVALAIGSEAVISQHLGDLDTEPAFRAFEDAVTTLEGLYESEHVRYVCDMHPDYASTLYARRTRPRDDSARRLALPANAWKTSRGGRANRPGEPGFESDSDASPSTESEPSVLAVQHHHAHVVSCMIDNELDGPVLGVAWDGTGYGPDGTVWGGEFLLATRGAYRRVAHLRCFNLPGGETAVREPRRAALGMLHEILGETLFDMHALAPVRAFDAESLIIMRQLLKRGVQSARTSSAGRLFDAVSSLLGLRQVNSFEGQGAMELEFVAYKGSDATAPYHIPFRDEVADWAPMIRRIMVDLRNGRDIATIARAFHEGLAHLIVEVAQAADEKRVVLSGGCFQNSLLLERSLDLLREAGFEPYGHHQVPPNDGGISLGQLGIALNLKPEP